VIVESNRNPGEKDPLNSDFSFLVIEIFRVCCKRKINAINQTSNSIELMDKERFLKL